MAWIIIGGHDRAAFACNTVDEAFGPLHTNYGTGSARDELRTFAESLDDDPRKLYNRGSLREKYVEWKTA